MASPTWWTWVWANSRSCGWIGKLACCSPWGHKELDTTEQLNWTDSVIKRTELRLYSEGQGSLACCSPWGRKESDTSEWLNWTDGGFIPGFLRNLYTVLHSGCINLHFHQQVQECSLFSTPSSAFIVCMLFDDGHSDWCEGISHFVLICISLIMSNAEHLFMCLSAIWMSSLEKCLLGLFPTFWLGCLFFWYWVVRAAYIFWKLILCQLFPLGEKGNFLPFWGLSFHLIYSFLCCAKVFKFNYILLIYFCFYFHDFRRWVTEDLAVIFVKECAAYVVL